MTTVYTFHRAADHKIIDTAEPENLQAKTANIAARIHRGLPDADLKRTRIYIHNGRGIIAAGLCRAGLWHDILRDDYMAFETKAAAERKAAGYPLDKEAAQ